MQMESINLDCDTNFTAFEDVPDNQPFANTTQPSSSSSSVSVSLKVEPQLKDSIGELAAEAMAMGILPFTVHDLKRDILIWRSGVEAQYSKVFVVGTGLEEVLRS